MTFRPSALGLTTTRRKRKSPWVKTRRSERLRSDCCPSSSISCRSFASGVTKKQVAVKSTRGIALKAGHGMMVKTGTPGSGGGPGGGSKAGQQGHSGGGGDNTHRNTRLFFDGEESCYIIDAKLEGNLGRYLNVSTFQSVTLFVSMSTSFIEEGDWCGPFDNITTCLITSNQHQTHAH